MLRFYINRAPVAALMCWSMFGCSNPTQDYEDFRGRVANTVDSAPPPDSGVDTTPEVARDGSVFEEAGVDAFGGTFWGACLDGAYAGDLSKSTYDVFIFNLTKDAVGAVTMSGSRQGLRADASNLSQLVGTVVTLPPTPVNADGSFVTKVATFISPKEANGFGLDLTVEKGAYAFTFQSTEGGCGRFTGTVTSPLVNPVDEVCIFKRANPDGSYPRITNPADLRCP